MSSETFLFKRFAVDQRGCAMRINTDGVLLGALLSTDVWTNMLDIGTGTGVIAMMLAQRFDGCVDAIDIDDIAAAKAGANFGASEFADRLRSFHGDMRTFEPDRQYDLIVSNPPFFVNALKNPDKRKGVARHAEAGFFTDMVDRVDAWLAPSGIFGVVLPVAEAKELARLAALKGLGLISCIDIHSSDDKPLIRKLLCFSKKERNFVYRKFCIYTPEGKHSAEYMYALKDFFLIF